MSPDALKILALPHAHHPQLSRLIGRMAETRTMTLEKAHIVLGATCAELGLTELDIEMCQPSASTSVAFIATKTNDGDAHQESVLQHVRSMLEARK